MTSVARKARLEPPEPVERTAAAASPGRGPLAPERLVPSAVRGLAICLVGALFGILLNALSPRGIPLLGPLPSRAEEIGLEEAHALYLRKGTIFVDARPAKEFAEGHIPGAMLFPGEDFEETVSSWKQFIPADTLLVTYCSGEGCASSRNAAELLLDAGYSRVKVFFGGWKEWKKAGYPVERGSAGGVDGEASGP